MVSKKDRKLAYNLQDFLKKMNKGMRRQLNNPLQLSFTEIDVLRLVMSRKGITPSELCTELKISSQFMSQVLNRVEGLGFIARAPLATDKRKTAITLARSAESKIEDMRQEKNEWLAGLIAQKFNHKEKDLLREAIGLLSSLTEF